MLIELQNITKIYPGNHRALNAVSVRFDTGEIVGLLGVNGSGKTTCSTILAGLHPPTSGDLLFQGKSALSDIANYRRHVGYCPQHPTLNEMLTVYDNLYFGGLYFGLTETKVKAAADRVISMFGLGDYLGKYPPMLSGGYQQRVMLARALIHDPQFIILDEPTVGLDPAIRKKLWDIILELKKLGKSILLTTHYLEEADILCDRICILDAGHILRIATKDELKSEHQQKDLEDIFMKLTAVEE
ncbi:MAG: ABC transporter ATP-binding protein [Pseudomonadota bacterium]